MPEEFDRRRILVVDDEERMVRFIRMNLEHDGFQVNEAFNGREAIQKIRDVNPDLILLDVMLPKLDGFDVCAELRKAGVVVRAERRDLLAEEASLAYKDVEAVVRVAAGAGHIRPVARLRPLAVIKG